MENITSSFNPKCPKCGGSEFITLSHPVMSSTGSAVSNHYFVCCKECHTTVGAYPDPDDSLRELLDAGN